MPQTTTLQNMSLLQAAQDPSILRAYASDIQKRKEQLLKDYPITHQKAEYRATMDVIHLQQKWLRLDPRNTPFQPSSRWGRREQEISDKNTIAQSLPKPK